MQFAILTQKLLFSINFKIHVLIIPHHLQKKRWGKLHPVYKIISVKNFVKLNKEEIQLYNGCSAATRDLRMYFSDNFCVGRQDKRFFYLKCHGIISHDERERMSRKHSRIFLGSLFSAHIQNHTLITLFYKRYGTLPNA